jgi:sugar fermentation stimulation protein A
MGMSCEFYFREELTQGEFISRSNRFSATVSIDGNIHEVHVPTTSRMKELLITGTTVYLSYNASVKRKTSFDLVAVLHNGIMISIDSGMPNKILRQALFNHQIDELSDWNLDKCEVKFNSSRLDFRLVKAEKIMYIEAKSVTLVSGKTALFPDAPTSRGTRHLFELIEAKKSGFEAAVIFIIQRDDADNFEPNAKTDSAFASALKHAHNAGVIILPIKCHITKQYVQLCGAVAFKL